MFKEKCTTLQSDEDLKKSAKEMARSFCVIVYQSSYNPADKKSSAKYDNYRVLVAKKEPLEKVKAAIYSSMDSGNFTFKLNEQIQVQDE